MEWFVNEPYLVSIVGKDCLAKRKQFDAKYLPNVLFSGTKGESGLEMFQNKNIEGQTTIYVCQNKICNQPETEIDKAILQIVKTPRPK
jgi:uncharacterized protein YyaL (SSP411 family)